MNEGMSPADVAAVVDNNRSYGYGYPVMPMYGGYGNSGFGDGSWIWIILILALFNGGWGNGFGGGFGGFGNTFNNDFAWLSNGQKEIMQNTNQGFDTLHLSNQIEGVRDGVFSLSNQLCNSTADVTQTINNGFASAEIANNGRQMANMQQAFASQTAITGGLTNLSSQLASCCCDNKLATQDLKATVISENCADREVLREIGQNILVNQNANTQKIIDEIFRDRLDEKDSKIQELNRQLQMADLRASQVAQTQAITSNIYNELKNCPVRNSSCIW